MARGRIFTLCAIAAVALVLLAILGGPFEASLVSGRARTAATRTQAVPAPADARMSQPGSLRRVPADDVEAPQAGAVADPPRIIAHVTAPGLDGSLRPIALLFVSRLGEDGATAYDQHYEPPFRNSLNRERTVELDIGETYHLFSMVSGDSLRTARRHYGAIVVAGTPPGEIEIELRAADPRLGEVEFALDAVTAVSPLNPTVDSITLEGGRVLNYLQSDHPLRGEVSIDADWCTRIAGLPPGTHIAEVSLGGPDWFGLRATKVSFTVRPGRCVKASLDACVGGYLDIGLRREREFRLYPKALVEFRSVGDAPWSTLPTRGDFRGTTGMGRLSVSADPFHVALATRISTALDPGDYEVRLRAEDSDSADVELETRLVEIRLQQAVKVSFDLDRLQRQ